MTPVEDHPLVRWRMARAARGETWGGRRAFAQSHAAYIDAV